MTYSPFFPSPAHISAVLRDLRVNKHIKLNLLIFLIPYHISCQIEDYLVWKQLTMGEQVVFDSKALNGLRGLAALHILVFHAFYCSTLNINILGAVRANLHIRVGHN